MRALPPNIDADAVIAIGQYLDDHGAGRPVSIQAALSGLRRALETRLSDHDLEELVVEMCTSRKLAVLFDRRDQMASSAGERRADRAPAAD